MKQVIAMKVKVHMKFLYGKVNNDVKGTRIIRIEYALCMSDALDLLFKGNVFFLKEHVEYLVSEGIVVNWHCYKKYHDNGYLGNENCVVSLNTIQRFSFQHDSWSLTVSREITSSCDDYIEGDVYEN